MDIELTRSLVAMASAIIALLVFIKGVIEFAHLNTIRRYEKFHDMSVRFDKNRKIQAVCKLLHGTSPPSSLSKQDKEVFICFLEEIYFMMNTPGWFLRMFSRRIMNPDLALYTFGYYARLARDNNQFWQGLDRNEPLYAHFLEFCRLASCYSPTIGSRRRKLAY